MARNYEEIVEKGSWMRNQLLKTVYENLSNMSKVDIDARMDEIKETLAELEREAFRRNRTLTKQLERRQDVNEENAKKVDELTEMAEKLENEMEILNYLPGVEYIMLKIAEIREDKKLEILSEAESKAKSAKVKEMDEEKRLAIATENAEKAKKAVEEADKKAKEAEEKLKKINEIENDINKISVQMPAFEKFPEIYGTMKETVEDLQKEIDGIGKAEELKQDIADLDIAIQNAEEAEKGVEEPKKALQEARKAKQIADNEFEKIKNGNYPKDIVMTRCEDPWNTVLLGCSWEEIATMKDDELVAAINEPEIETSNPEPNSPAPELEPAPAPWSASNPPAPSTVPNSPEPEIEEEPEPEAEPESEPTSEPPVPESKIPKFLRPFTSWVSKTWGKLINRFKRKPKEQEMESSDDDLEIQRLELRVKQVEASVNRINRQLENLKLERKPELTELIDDCREKLDLEYLGLDQASEIAAMAVALGAYTENEVLKKMQQLALKEGKGADEVIIQKTDSSFLKGIREEVDKQLPYMSKEEIEERIPTWKFIELYSQDRITEIQVSANVRAMQKEEAISKSEIELIEKQNELRELQEKLGEKKKIKAEKDGISDSETSANKHTKFASKLDARGSVKPVIHTASTDETEIADVEHDEH